MLYCDTETLTIAQLAAKLLNAVELNGEELTNDTTIKVYDGIILQTPFMDDPRRLLAREMYRVSQHMIF